MNLKKYTLLLASICIGITLHAQGYQVKNYSADFYLSDKGYLDVVEKYDIDFSIRSHGIYRNIVTQFDYENPQGEIEKRRIYISKLKTPREKIKLTQVYPYRIFLTNYRSV